MSYFFSEGAEYKAKRIAQILAHTAGMTQVAAQRDGKVLANYNGHMHLFNLDENRNLKLIDSVDAVRNTQPPVIEIV